jgi:hypothetical protein
MTNANSSLIASVLGDARKGTFTGLITTKRGVTRGPKGSKVTYGDDEIHTVILTGFKYENLVSRSLASLDDTSDADIVAKGAVDGKGNALTEADVAAARLELRASFERTLNPDEESTSTTAHVYEPLVVDGEVVRGGRVYRCTGKPGGCHCRECSGDKRAPLDGTIYLQGLRIWGKVLTPAPNGPAPKPKSAAKTVAKNMLRRGLPVSRYVSYRLEPGTPFLLRAGGTAQVEAQTDGFKVTDAIVDVLSKAS